MCLDGKVNCSGQQFTANTCRMGRIDFISTNQYARYMICNVTYIVIVNDDLFTTLSNKYNNNTELPYRVA